MGKSPDKKSSRERPRTETFSLGDEFQQIIHDEMDRVQSATGIRPSKTGVMRFALQLLKEHREASKKAAVKIKNSAENDLQKSAEAVKAGKKK